MADLTETVLRRFLLLCESPRTRRRVLRMVRASVSDSRAGARAYAAVNRLVLHPAARAARVEVPIVRMELATGHLVGLAMMRYVLRVEPLASLPVEDVVAEAAPGLRQVLRGRRQPAVSPPATCACADRRDPLPADPAALPVMLPW